MFDESRRNVTILIAVGILAVLIVFGLVIWWLAGERIAQRDSNFTTSSQTTVYVDPSQCPLCRNVDQDGNLIEDETPNVTEGSSYGTTPTVSGGGFFSSLFSGVPRDLPSGYTASDLSSQFRLVRISGVQRAGNYTGSGVDTITIKENIGANDGAVNLTGMTLKSNQGSYAIQRAAKIYKTSGSALTNVTLANGQQANIYGGPSAVQANFMGNSCMGFLSSQYPFAPKLSGSCTRPTKNEIATFSGTCQEYILRMKTCEAGNPADSRIPADDNACRNFVSGINYDGCVKKNQANENFYTNVWNVWAGKSFIDPLHDRILLLDANGKLVDYFVY